LDALQPFGFFFCFLLLKKDGLTLTSEAFNVSLLVSVQVMKQSRTSEGEFDQELLQKCIVQHKNTLH